jgi:hypothetical protein
VCGTLQTRTPIRCVRFFPLSNLSPQQSPTLCWGVFSRRGSNDDTLAAVHHQLRAALGVPRSQIIDLLEWWTTQPGYIAAIAAGGMRRRAKL